MRHRPPAEDVAVATVAEGDDQQFGAVEDAFDLQRQELRGPAAQRVGGLLAFLVDQRVDLVPQSVVGDAQEPPGLHQTDAGCGVRGRQQPGQHRLGHRRCRG